MHTAIFAALFTLSIVLMQLACIQADRKDKQQQPNYSPSFCHFGFVRITSKINANITAA
jgi:hypothetical protein